MENSNRDSEMVVIKPKTGLFDLHLKEVFKYKDLIFLFVKRNFVSQYKQTVLGPAWAIIQPFISTVVFTLVFGNIAKLGPDGKSGIYTFLFFMVGNILWGYFSGCLTGTSNTFIANSGILGKVYFPRLVMPITQVISQLISFAIQYVFMLCFWIYELIFVGDITVNIVGVIMTPLLMLQLAMLGLGCGIVISSLTTKYRDLNFIVGFGVSLWMYATPVAYDMFSGSMGAALGIGGKWHALIMCNPVVPIINIFRWGYFGCGEVEWLFYAISWIVTVILFFFGVVLFSRTERTFMDTV